MWNKLAKIILRNRLALLIGLGLVTIVMGFFATKVELQYEFAKLLPDGDSTALVYEEFKEEFGQDGLIIVLSCNDEDLYEPEKFQKWYEMGNRLKSLEVVNKQLNDGSMIGAIDSVFSEAHLYVLNKNKAEKKFTLDLLFDGAVDNEEELDSLRRVVNNTPFYSDLVYREETHMHLMLIFVNDKVFNSKSRGTLVSEITKVVDDYEPSFGEFHFSGLPYIRSVTMNKVQKELSLFVFLALGVTGLLLFFFFRSFKVVLVSMVVVAVGVIWSMGSIGLIGYKITIIMGLIPPLIIVIGIPNCIYLINKYQQEYRIHGNKAKGLTRVIRKVGNATFMTNATTAMGFGTFIFTDSDMMKEFGIIAGLNILAMFVLSILIVPTIYSYLKPPKAKHTRHLEKKWLFWSVEKLVLWTTRYRSMVYGVSLGLVGLGLWGMALMRTSGNIVDDLPKNDKVVKDLKYFENELGGVMPFEIILEAKDTIYRKNAYRNFVTIDSVQANLRELPYLSRSMSMVDAIKYVKQANANGNPKSYQLGSERSLGRLLESEYFDNTFSMIQDDSSSSSFVSGFLDSTHLKTRITLQIADIGTDSMAKVLDQIKERLDQVVKREIGIVDEALAASDEERDKLLSELYSSSGWVKMAVEEKLIEENEDLEFEFMDDENLVFSFHGDTSFHSKLRSVVNNGSLDYDVTGSGVIYTKGTTYLVSNLMKSLMIAIVLIAILMSFLFYSWRMVLVSLLPNLIPLIVTSAIMGIVGIPIKPSTILVFSIAFGISVDDTIHFLAKYRQELAVNGWDIKGSVINAIRETGISMIYTSIILSFGFSIFIASNFGGTQALGVLVSVTLFVAMLANLVLLPSLLLSLEKRLTTKAFKDPLLEVVDEEEDIELEELIIKK